MHAVQNPKANFSSYRTFSMGPAEAPPPRYRTSERSAEARKKLVGLISAELQRKGYVPAAEGKGDFVVMFASGRRETTNVHETWSRDDWIWLDEDEELDFVEGSIVVDAYESTGDKLIWHGSIRTQLQPGKPDDVLFARSVRELMEKFPLATAR